MCLRWWGGGGPSGPPKGVAFGGVPGWLDEEGVTLLDDVELLSGVSRSVLTCNVIVLLFFKQNLTTRNRMQ